MKIFQNNRNIFFIFLTSLRQVLKQDTTRQWTCAKTPKQTMWKGKGKKNDQIEMNKSNFYLRIITTILRRKSYCWYLLIILHCPMLIFFRPHQHSRKWHTYHSLGAPDIRTDEPRGAFVPLNLPLVTGLQLSPYNYNQVNGHLTYFNARGVHYLQAKYSPSSLRQHVWKNLPLPPSAHITN